VPPEKAVSSLSCAPDEQGFLARWEERGDKATA
jgi:hypothetical protein